MSRSRQRDETPFRHMARRSNHSHRLMKTVSIFLVLLTGADVLAGKPLTNDIPSLNAQVTALRFFETPDNLLSLRTTRIPD